MMRSLLTALARRITREETFDCLVAPALADLHVDATAGRPLGRHYSGLVLVTATALVRDIRIDIRLTFGARDVWVRTAAWYAGLAAVQIGLMLYAWPETRSTLVVVRMLVSANIINPLPLTIIAAAFYLRRRTAAPHRTIPIATLGFALLLVGLNVDSIARANAIGLPSLRALLAILTMVAFYAAFYLSSFAMLGVVLAQSRRWWTVPLRGLGLIVTFLMIQAVTITLARAYDMPDPNFLRQIGGLFVTPIVWLIGTHVLRWKFPRQLATAR